jgi:hypothetical protein
MDTPRKAEKARREFLDPRNLLLLLLSTALCLGAVEFLLRTLSSRKTLTDWYLTTANLFSYDPRFTRMHEVYGFLPHPNQDSIFRNKEFATRVQTNSKGFRDDENSLSNPDIILAGDSFCFGWGVDQEETVEANLERSTGRLCLNVGVPSYSSLQEYLVLRDVLADISPATATLVWLIYYNDLGDNVEARYFDLPTLWKQGVEVRVEPPAHPELWQEMAELHSEQRWAPWATHSILADRILRTLFPAFPRIREILKREEKEYPPPPGLRVNRYETVDYLFRLARQEFLEARGCPMHVFYIPSIIEVEEGERAKDAQVLEERMESIGIPFHDLRADLVLEDYLPLDTHLNARGQARMAEAVERELKAAGMF